MDPEYLMSAGWTADISLPCDGTKIIDAENFAYILWDEDYVYICVVVYDNDLMTRGQQYCNEAKGNNPYCNDVCELFYAFGFRPESIKEVRKLSIDAYGYRLFTNAGEGHQSAHFEDCSVATSVHINEEDPWQSYYICEFKIPAKTEDVPTQEIVAGKPLAIGDSIYVSTQIGDISVGLDQGYPSASTSGEYNETGFKWSQSRNQLPDGQGDNGYSNLVLSDILPSQVGAEDIDEFPTRILYSADNLPQ